MCDHYRILLTKREDGRYLAFCCYCGMSKILEIDWERKDLMENSKCINLLE